MRYFLLGIFLVVALSACGDIEFFPKTVITTTAIAISTTSLPGGTVNTAYNQTLAATGGTTPYTWTVSSGSLPAGLSLSPAGVITGTPTTAATSSFTVKLTDASSPQQTATKDFSIVIS